MKKKEITYNNVPESKLKVKRYKYYHLFSDGIDLHIDILGLGEAAAKREVLKMKKDWLSKGMDNIRIYIIEEEEDYRDGYVETIQEDCIYSKGSYPY